MKNIVKVIGCLILILGLTVSAHAFSGGGNGGSSGGGVPGSLSPYTGAVGITANSGSSDFINGLGTLQKVIYVDGYGAKGDGSTNDSAAIQAAVTAACAAGGAEIRFTEGKNYYHNTLSTCPASSCSVSVPCSNIFLNFNGSTQTAGTNITGASSAIYVVGDVTDDFESQTKYAINNALRGDVTLTTTTAANAGNMTAPGWVWVRGENSDLSDLGVYPVLAKNASTGVVTIGSITGKPYNISSPVISDVTSLMKTNVRIEDGTFVQNSAIWSIDIGEISGWAIRNNTFNSIPTTGEPIGIAYMRDGIYENNTFNGTCTTIDMSGRAEQNVLVKGNHAYAVGGCSNLNVSTIGESAESISFVGNVIQNTDTSNNGAALDISGSWDTTVVGNQLKENATGTAAVLVTNNGTAAANYAMIVSNSISSHGVGIISGGNFDDIEGNWIETLSAANCIDDTAGGTFAGNVCRATGTTNGIIVQSNTSASHSNIDHNDISTGASGTCIRVTDPGSIPSIDIQITNNTTSGCGTKLVVANVADDPARVILGNQGIPDFRNDNAIVRNINQVNALGTIGSSGTATCDLSVASICSFNGGNYSITIGTPSNGVVGQTYYLSISSTANYLTANYSSGWQEWRNDQGGVISVGTSLSLVGMASGASVLVPFIYDGSKYEPIGAFPQVSANLAWFRNLQSFAATVQAGGLSLTGGGVISSTGGTAPTCSAATGTCITVANANCTGSTTPWACCTGSGTGTCSGSTNNRGQMHLTGGTAVTALTLTFSGAGTWNQAPYCEFTQGGAAAAPLGYSSPLGPCASTSACIATLASATAADVNYQCQ